MTLYELREEYKAVLAMMEDPDADAQLKDFLEDRLNSAAWLIRSIPAMQSPTIMTWIRRTFSRRLTNSLAEAAAAGHSSSSFRSPAPVLRS